MKDADTAAQEPCTKQLVLTVAKKPKFRSSQLKADRSTVGNATKNTGSINLIIFLTAFYHLFYFSDNFVICSVNMQDIT
jgi:hypothetical protein